MSVRFPGLKYCPSPPLITAMTYQVHTAAFCTGECSMDYDLITSLVTLYFKVSLLQSNYTFKYRAILINYTMVRVRLRVTCM